MGLSIGDFLRGVGNALLPGTPFAPGGGLDISATDLGTFTGQAARGFVAQERSTLGDAEVLVPDFIERAIGTMPTNAQVGGCDVLSLTAAPIVTTRLKAPRKGMVIVTCGQDSAGNPIKVAMAKPVARALGLWKARRRPLITAAEGRSLTKAAATVKKFKRVQKRVGIIEKSTRRRRVA